MGFTRGSLQRVQLVQAQLKETILGNVVVPLGLVGARLLHVSVDLVFPYVTQEPIVQALSTFGKVKGISYVTFRDRPDIMTGTRVMKVEMTKLILNFINIQGRRVMVDYRGLRRVCSKCGQEGNIGPACKTPRCNRCAVFGHATAGCTNPCQRRGHAHATVGCTQRKTIAAVTQSTSTLPFRETPQRAATVPVVSPASEQPKDNPSPSIHPQDLPPPHGNPVAAHDSQSREADSPSPYADRLCPVRGRRSDSLPRASPALAHIPWCFGDFQHAGASGRQRHVY
ncbi:hypothetical protein HPB47_009243 [Ixodes persulcatus]|uniref:Uncharacterized protein n=1 Tax=Ixodes persulcatus TaxID=34615 RepID=A0AC60P2E3_IXOPE|nr:hypothetical protein HPB47_009243 [Ixodes persulcatus]